MNYSLRKKLIYIYLIGALLSVVAPATASVSTNPVIVSAQNAFGQARDWTTQKAKLTYATVTQKAQKAYGFAREHKKAVGAVAAYLVYELIAYNYEWRLSLTNTLFGGNSMSDNSGVGNPTSYANSPSHVSQPQLAPQLPGMPRVPSSVHSDMQSAPAVPIVQQPIMMVPPVSDPVADNNQLVALPAQNIVPENMKQYYTVLGVPHNANTSVLDKAYKKLMLQHHPDKAGSLQKAQEVIEAYNILKNPHVASESSVLLEHQDALRLEDIKDNLSDSWRLIPSQEEALATSWVNLAESQIGQAIHDPVQIKPDLVNITDQERGRITDYQNAIASCLDVNNSVRQVLRIGDYTKEPRKVLFVIHGTFSPESTSFFHKDGKVNDTMDGFENFARYLKGADESIDVISFKWTGFNSVEARDRAASELAELMDLCADKTIYTVSHSHGGNVIHAASHLLKHATIEEVVGIFTPVRVGEDKRFTPNMNRINNAYCFYSTQDLIQWGGAFEKTISLSPFKGGRKQRDSKIYNIRVQYNANGGPPHTNKAPLAHMLPTIVGRLRTHELIRDLDMNIDTHEQQMQLAMRQGSDTESIMQAIYRQINESPELLNQLNQEYAELTRGAYAFREKYANAIGNKGWSLGIVAQVWDFLVKESKGVGGYRSPEH